LCPLNPLMGSVPPLRGKGALMFEWRPSVIPPSSFSATPFLSLIATPNPVPFDARSGFLSGRGVHPSSPVRGLVRRRSPSVGTEFKQLPSIWLVLYVRGVSCGLSICLPGSGRFSSRTKKIELLVDVSRRSGRKIVLKPCINHFFAGLVCLFLRSASLIEIVPLFPHIFTLPQAPP